MEFSEIVMNGVLNGLRATLKDLLYSKRNTYRQIGRILSPLELPIQLKDMPSFLDLIEERLQVLHESGRDTKHIKSMTRRIQDWRSACRSALSREVHLVRETASASA